MILQEKKCPTQITSPTLQIQKLEIVHLFQPSQRRPHPRNPFFFQNHPQSVKVTFTIPPPTTLPRVKKLIGCETPCETQGEKTSWVWDTPCETHGDFTDNFIVAIINMYIFKNT